MINICASCGEYRADKIIDPGGPYAICPLCEHRHPFRQLPLLTVCGPSTAGKTTVCRRLAGQMEEAVLLDADVLWHPAFNTPDNNFREFFENWLRMAKNINQSGRPLVLFNSGSLPQNLEPCVERRYFSEIHYLALVCQEDELIRRLRQRPEWRNSQKEQYVEDQRRFSRWFTDQEESADSTNMQFIDTTSEPVDATAKRVAAWIRQLLA